MHLIKEQLDIEENLNKKITNRTNNYNYWIWYTVRQYFAPLLKHKVENTNELLGKKLKNCCDGKCNNIKIYRDKKDICISYIVKN